MLDKIAIILKNQCQLNISDLLLVGFSAGPDSVFLLHILHTLDYHLIAAHVNHGLRPEADAEARHAQYFAADLGVKFLSRRVDVRSFADENSISIEEAARTMRYQYLFEQAKNLGASAVLVGHNADDQVETILMHILRGSGLSGLRGMAFRSLPNAWSDRIALIRPLLSTQRKDILKYLAERNLTHVSDKSNLDTMYFRNRLRHELIPILEAYNPQIKDDLLRLGQISRDDYTVLQQFVAGAWKKLIVEKTPAYLSFNIKDFRSLSPSIQRYFLRKAIGYYLPGLRDVGFDCIERAVHFLSDDHTHGQVDLLAGVYLEKEYELARILRTKSGLPVIDLPAIEKGEELIIEIGSTISLVNDWNLRCVEARDSRKVIQQCIHETEPFHACIDLRGMQLPLIVRCRKPGERFQPMGMDGHTMKVSDLMINLKIPSKARSTWPLVCSGEEIIWIPGYRVSQKARLKPDSCEIIELILRRETTT